MTAWLSKSSKVELLKKVPLFDGFTRRQLEQVARLADEVEVPASKHLARAGDTGRELFIILDGRATVKTPQGRIVRLGPGDFFGEMSLLDGGQRSADVDADTSRRLLVVAQRDFWTLLGTAPLIARKIMIALSNRLRKADAAFSPCT